MRDRNWTLPGARWLAASLSIALLVAAPASAQITSTCPRSADYVLVTDVGFSTYAVLDDMKAAENYLLDLLEWTNRAGAVSYETTATLDHGLTWVFDPVRAAIDGYAEGGYPDLAAGIRTAQEHLEATGAPNPVMVILQHGMPTHGGPHSHEGMAYAQLEAANAHRAGTQVFAIALSNYEVVRYVLQSRIALTPSHFYDGTVLPLDVIMNAIYARVCLCGDGVVDALEQCDDGNTIIGDGCGGCAVDSVCGDGFISVGESCDDGMHCFGGSTPCTTDAECTVGDGLCLPRSGARQCPADCILDPPNCGDDVTQAGEQCDDGNTEPGDGCYHCLVECEDSDGFDIETVGSVIQGSVSGTDHCDFSGNLVEFVCNPCIGQDGHPILAPSQVIDCVALGYDGCVGGVCFSASSDPDPELQFVCDAAYWFCGDGNLDPTEVCDDGNTDDGDGCDSMCNIEQACGDGVVTEGEECDDGNQDDGDGCSNDCMLECGDGVLDPDEECDDGNREDGDGCSRFCLLESTCGDGVLDPDEQCDDGNTDDGDGCSSTCDIEITLSVEFSHFEAVCVEGGIDVNWTTVSEVDTLAFLVMRGATASGPFVQVGRVYSSGGGSSYTFHDTAPVPGIFNWYSIEEVVGTAGPPSVTPVFTTDTLCSIPTTCGGVADPPCPPGYVCFCSGQGGNEVCGCIPGGGNIP